MSMKLGYAKVSTIGQYSDIQIKQLEKHRVSKENIYIEKHYGISRSS